MWGTETRGGESDADRAVSPVIGVVLMVALTIVLAGTVHAFVFGIADDNLHDQPMAGFSFETDATECKGDGLSVTHVSGDTIPADQLYLRSDALSKATGDTPSGSWTAPGGYTTSGLEDGAVSAGSSATLCVGEGGLEDETVQVVWRSESGERSAVLAEWDG